MEPSQYYTVKMFLQRFDSAKFVQSRYIIQEEVITNGSCKRLSKKTDVTQNSLLQFVRLTVLVLPNLAKPFSFVIYYFTNLQTRTG